MAPVTNGRLIFNETPQGFPKPGKTTVYDTSETIDLEEAPLDGGFLVKTLVLSIEPYILGRMLWVPPPYVIGKPIINFGVGVVLRSEHPSVNAGDHIYGDFPFQEYFITKGLPLQRVLKNEEKLPLSVYLGVCGMPGQTAYYGWHEFSFAKKGEVAFVSSGAGAVGAMVVQLAKADGMKVVASAGSEEKLAFMKSLGADVVFNYKTTDTAAVLQKEGPIDVYWDNVGGATLDAALSAAASQARFIECGMNSTYNGGTPYGVKNLGLMVGREIRMSGFVVSKMHGKYLERFHADVPARVARGEIKYLEHVTEGLENGGQAIPDMLSGANNGKSVIVVARE